MKSQKDGKGIVFYCDQEKVILRGTWKKDKIVSGDLNLDNLIYSGTFKNNRITGNGTL